MKFVDANVLLRYILKDNENMYAQAVSVIEQGSFTTCEVLAEVVYVLKGVYNISRDDISWYLHELLLDVQTDNIKALMYAASVYSQTSLDFVDCILTAYRKVYDIDVFTFDLKLNSSLSREYMIFQN